MKFLRWVLGMLAVLALGLGVVSVVARFSDGPIGAIAGGPLVAGEPVSGPDDWAFVEDIPIIEFQLIEPPRSRTVWIVHHEGAAYIPCGLPQIRLWKQWPHEALVDGRAVLRIEGRLYEGRLVRVEDTELHAAVAKRMAEKYEVDGMGPDALWIFRFDS